MINSFVRQRDRRWGKQRKMFQVLAHSLMAATGPGTGRASIWLAPWRDRGPRYLSHPRWPFQGHR